MRRAGNWDNLQQISERTERVKARNRVAAEIVKERGIATNDFFELVEPNHEFFSADGVHFNGKGKEAPGKLVADSVLDCLRKPNPDISSVCSRVRQNVGRVLELRPRSGERSYDSVSRNYQGREISGLTRREPVGVPLTRRRPAIG